MVCWWWRVVVVGGAEHYAKICTVSTVVRWASASSCLCRGGCLGSLARSVSDSGLIMCDSARRKAGRGWNERKRGRGGGSLYRDRPSPPPDIMDESMDAVLCTFSADPARRGWGAVGRFFVQLPMAWQLEFEFSSLCHYYTPPSPYFLLLKAHSHGNICAYTHTHTHTHTLACTIPFL